MNIGMNSSGKVLTIFLVIIAILLISLTALSLFFFQRETDRRKLAEAVLEETRAENVKLEKSIKDMTKQNFLLQEKNKEADDRVNDLTDELELEKGLREEMKIEMSTLKTQSEEAVTAKEALQEELQAKETLHEELTATLAVSEEKIKALEAELKAREPQPQSDAPGPGAARRNAEVGGDLEEIVVAPSDILQEQQMDETADADAMEAPGPLQYSLEGRVLSVDTETEFVIVSLGQKDGVRVGHVLSVFRDQDYLGDIKITRLQPEMSAADLVPPFSVERVERNDQVKAK